MEREPFTVDFLNPEDIRVKYAKAKLILKSHEDERERVIAPIERQIEEWRTNVAFLESKLPTDPPASELPMDPPASVADQPGDTAENEVTVADLVAEVVDRDNRKIRSAEVRDILRAEGHDVSTQAVSNALYYAAHKPKRIKAASGRGFYAPLTYIEAPVTDYAAAAANGFPVPDTLHAAVDDDEHAPVEGGGA